MSLWRAVKHPVRSFRYGSDMLTQREYFRIVDRELEDTEHMISFFGLDIDYMKRGKTEQRIRNAASRGVDIAAILPSNNPSYLHTLSLEYDNVDVVTCIEEISEGRIWVDDLSLFVWDSKRLTAYPPEQDEGVIFRQYCIMHPDHPDAEEIAEHQKKQHKKMRQDIEESRIF